MHQLSQTLSRGRMLGRSIVCFPGTLPTSLPPTPYYDSLMSSVHDNRFFYSKNSWRHRTYPSNTWSANWFFMLGLALTGGTLCGWYLDSRVTAASKLYDHHFFCADCGKLNGTDKYNVNYMRTRCCHCGEGLVLFGRKYYATKEGTKFLAGYFDPTGVFAGLLRVGDGIASRDASAIVLGSLSIATLGLSNKVYSQEISDSLNQVKTIEELKNVLMEGLTAPTNNKMSAYHLYDYLTDEDFQQIIDTIDCVSTSNTVDTRAFRAVLASAGVVAASTVTVPFDFLKATGAVLIGGIKTVAEGGDFDSNCDEVMDSMGGWSTKQVFDAGQEFVEGEEGG